LSRRLLLFAVIALTALLAEDWWLSALQPADATALAVSQFEGAGVETAELRANNWSKEVVQLSVVGVLVLAAWFCFGEFARTATEKFKNRGLKSAAALALLATLSLAGCVNSFDRPEYVEIETSETGFLIPPEGGATLQARFQLEDYLKQRKVATKRVQILHRWSQEGRWFNELAAGYRPFASSK
jgi:hypothetical protein